MHTLTPSLVHEVLKRFFPAKNDDCASEYIEEFVAKRLREGFWFSYPALLRIALELEYGKSYEEYADKRDGIA